MSDDYDDFIERIKKMFNIDSDKFDIDLFFMPESNMKLPFNPDNKNIKGFKISYHFNEEMDKPEIRFEGDIDRKKIAEYLKNIDLSKHPQFKKIVKRRKSNVIDAKELSLEPCTEEESCVIEPFSEINCGEDKAEIIIEMPGIEKGHILISCLEDGKKVKITAENESRKFLKIFDMPFKVKRGDYDMEVNNGITTIILKRYEVNTNQ
jgi:HSP20 family molecular chaperone IbpA